MKERVKNFCREYAQSENKLEAAIRAGYAPEVAASVAGRLLVMPQVKQEIERWRKSTGADPPLLFEQMEHMLCRLAFSGDSNALRLLRLTPNSSEQELSSIDLSRVSEISLSGDGKITVKFIDRFKAFHLLTELAEHRQQGTNGDTLLAAIRESIAAVESGKWEGEWQNED